MNNKWIKIVSKVHTETQHTAHKRLHWLLLRDATAWSRSLIIESSSVKFITKESLDMGFGWSLCEIEDFAGREEGGKDCRDAERSGDNNGLGGVFGGDFEVEGEGDRLEGDFVDGFGAVSGRLSVGGGLVAPAFVCDFVAIMSSGGGDFRTVGLTTGLGATEGLVGLKGGGDFEVGLGATEGLAGLEGGGDFEVGLGATVGLVGLAVPEGKEGGDFEGGLGATEGLAALATGRDFKGGTGFSAVLISGGGDFKTVLGATEEWVGVTTGLGGKGLDGECGVESDGLALGEREGLDGEIGFLIVECTEPSVPGTKEEGPPSPLTGFELSESADTFELSDGTSDEEEDDGFGGREGGGPLGSRWRVFNLLLLTLISSSSSSESVQ